MVRATVNVDAFPNSVDEIYHDMKRKVIGDGISLHAETGALSAAANVHICLH